ncbi:hypothetical protein C7C46_28335 [Streptomyces tateyamensis]|uniref:Uncharacterized protein n=1 Tax=Streptomyces tateyamensis TaxID=565073 RepID=A0A2V4MUX3_9ACTN|nr:hypothetical protein [Streptomyces tateyamensis]PYC69159.1 hypothetical protein C7C46_28335 [Streptomyces tateyamensis]
MDRYPPIADHGPIGDLQTTAPVAAGGVLDRFRTPRRGSPTHPVLVDAVPVPVPAPPAGLVRAEAER